MLAGKRVLYCSQRGVVPAEFARVRTFGSQIRTTRAR